AFSPDGTRVLSGGDYESILASQADTLKLWDAASGQLLRSFAGHKASFGYVISVAFSPDGSRVLSGSADHTIKLWDVATGRLLRTFEGHADAVNSVRFSPDGIHAASGGSDGTTRIWSVATGELLA